MKLATSEQTNEFISQAEKWFKTRTGMFGTNPSIVICSVAEFIANQKGMTLDYTYATEIDGSSRLTGLPFHLQYSFLRRMPFEYLRKCELNSNSTLEECKQRMLWGTRGKSGKEPLKYVRLMDCETEHLKAIKSEPSVHEFLVIVISHILADREKQDLN